MVSLSPSPARACHDGVMRLLGNILWLILGGLFLALGWAIIGLVLCVTIIGIPLGVQAFKMATLTLTPFGKTVNVRWWSWFHAREHSVGGARRLVDGARLCGRGIGELHHDYRYSVWDSVV